MKIDLHFHSKKSKSDPDDNREIYDIKEAINIIKKSEVSVVAITNHNIFDTKQFEEFKRIGNKEIIFLSGIEFDVYINNDKNQRRQMNLIIHDSLIFELNKFLEENNISYDNPVDLKKVVETFDIAQKALFCIDNKNNNTSFKNDEIDKINKIVKNVPVILDVPNKNKFYYYLNWNCNSIVGSDTNIAEYEEKSKKLISSKNLVVRNFDDLYQIFSKNQSYKFFKNNHFLTEIKSLDLVDNQNKKISEINNIKIVKNSINVIFGPKATGKTTLLRSIYNYFKDSNSILYIPAEINLAESNNTKIIQDYFLKKENSNSFKNEKDELINKIEKLLKLNEDDENKSNLFMFYNSIAHKKNMNFKWETITYDYNDEDIEENIKSIIINYKSAINNISELEQKYLNKNNHLEFENNKNLTQKLKKYYINELIKIKKNKWRWNIINSLIKELKSIFIKYKGCYSKINSFGLYNKFIKRRKIFNQISKIKNVEINNEKIIKKNSIPNENNDEFKEIKIYAKFYRSWIHGDKNAFKSRSEEIKKFSDLLSELIKLKYLKNPNNIIKKLNEIAINYKDLFTEKYFISDTNNNELSTGEKSYLILNEIINSNNYDYVFIDEPESHLNNKFISKNILDSIIDLVYKRSKTLIITTHNSVLGINTNPNNYIFRDIECYSNNKNKKTWIGNLYEKKLININDMSDSIDINEKLLIYFEGSIDLYNERKKVYNV